MSSGFSSVGETLQPDLNQPLNQAETDRLRACVTLATDRGLTVLLDPHNYARHYDKVVGSADVPDAAFCGFLGKARRAVQG
jgi:endoglucanase